LKPRRTDNFFRNGAGRETTTANEAARPEPALASRPGPKKTTAETSLEKLSTG